MGRLMPLIGARLGPGSRVADRVLGWSGEPSPSGDSLPLRLAGALHALKLDGLALKDVYPPHEVSDEVLWAAVARALEDHAPRVLSWLESAPQTNEVRRSGVLLPALAEVARVYDLPVELIELGASAGLNLRCDQFWLEVPGGGLGRAGSPVVLSPEWRGAPRPGPLPRIVARRGVDLNPLDPARAEDRLRLRAYLWPDQAERLARTEAAIGIAGRVPAEVQTGDAADFVEQVFAEAAPDRLCVVYHTVAWQYFPERTKSRIEAVLRRVDTPALRIGMEADGGDGALISLTTYPTGEVRVLGRASFHGIWVDWQG